MSTPDVLLARSSEQRRRDPDDSDDLSPHAGERYAAFQRARSPSRC